MKFQINIKRHVSLVLFTFNVIFLLVSYLIVTQGLRYTRRKSVLSIKKMLFETY